MNAETVKKVMQGKVERSKGSGYAVKNVLQRLKAYYGDDFSVNIFSKPGIGTTVAIEVSKDIKS